MRRKDRRLQRLHHGVGRKEISLAGADAAKRRRKNCFGDLHIALQIVEAGRVWGESDHACLLGGDLCRQFSAHGGQRLLIGELTHHAFE